MINGSAAGHTFVNGVCTCGRFFNDIKDATDANVGETGWDHQGSTLRLYEVREIERLAEKYRAKIDAGFNAPSGASTGW